MNRRDFVKGAAALGIATAPSSLFAQQKFPSKPIRFVVPFAAGGGGDLTARMLAQRLSERLNNPVVVENRTGAGGNIGSDYVLKSAAGRLHAAEHVEQLSDPGGRDASCPTTRSATCSPSSWSRATRCWCS